MKKIEDFAVFTSSGKISWKETTKAILKALNDQIEFDSKEYETERLCPNCSKVIYCAGSEYYCKNPECKFDKTDGELFFYYAESNNLEYNEE